MKQSLSKPFLLTTLAVLLQISNAHQHSAAHYVRNNIHSEQVLEQAVQNQTSQQQVLQTNNSTFLNVSENIYYQGMKQDQRSFNFYRYVVPANRTAQQLNNSYLYFHVDSDDAQSSPEIFISKTVMNPKTQQESDHYCTRSGSNLCFMRKDQIKANDTLYISIRCMEKCQYSLRIGYAPIVNVTDGVSNMKQSMDGKSATVYQFQIPDSSYDGLTQSIQFLVETIAQTNPLEILFSLTDDLTLIEERHLDLVTENGKLLKYTSDDYGWCTGTGCVVYFIVSARVPGMYQVSGQSTSRKEIIPDQQSVVRAVNQFEKECFSYNILKSTNDVVFNIRQQQGDLDLSLMLKNPLNTSQEIPLVYSEVYSQRALISKASDRAKLGFTTGLIYLCATPYSDSTFQIYASQQYQLSRFDALDDTLYTFNLDPQEYLYFRYTSPMLANSRQIQIQLNNFIQTGTLPRMYYRICPFPTAEECYLSEPMSRGFWDGDVILQEILNANNSTTTQPNSKIGIINHNPSNCPFPISCYYLISVFNQDLVGSQKLTFRAQMLSQDPIPLMISSQYQDQINQNQLSQFTLNLTAIQLQNWNISMIYFNLTSYNGHAELLLSTGSRVPTLQNYEIRSRSLSPWTSISYNVSDKDLSSFKINVAVYGSVRTQYTLRVFADYFVNQPAPIKNDSVITIIQPQNITNTTNNTTKANTTQPVKNNQSISNQTNATVNTTKTNNSQNTSGNNNVNQQLVPIINFTYPNSTVNLTVVQSLLDLNTRRQYLLNSNSTDILLYYYPFANALNKPIHFYPQIDSITTNGSISFNVTYGNQSWNNNSIGLTLQPDQYQYNPQFIFSIRIRYNFSRTNRTMIMNQLYPTQQNTSSKNQVVINPFNILLNATVRFGVFASNQSANFVESAQLNTVYEGFANNSYVVFKTLLMDTNGTYKFRLDNGIGKPYLMQKNGPLVLQQFDIIDDTTYDFASSAPDTYDFQEITVTKFMRENANFRCRNASYTLRGGNENCSMYVAVQCKSMCTFNLTITLLEAQNRTVKIPTLLKQNSLIQDSVDGKSIQYYYTPFIRGDMNDSALILRKQFYNDTFIVARIIANGYLPYFNWSYPSQNSYDLISRTLNDSVEILELTQPFLNSKCMFNSSCILIIGVINNSTVNTFPQSYKLEILSSQNRIGNNSLTSGYILSQNQMSYYWFLINTTNSTSRNVTWRHLITAAPSTTLQDVDVYINVIDSNSPTVFNYDYKADRLGNDLIVLSSDNSIFRSVPNRERILVKIGILARSSKTNFTLMNWGPQAYEQSYLNYTDVKVRQPQNITLQPKNKQPTQNYRIIRFFNYGIRDLLINITSIDGQVYALANKNYFKLQVTNSYFNIPIAPQLSKIPIQNLNKSQSLALRINSTVNSELMCQFCWIYVTVFQNNSNIALTSTFQVNITDMSNSDATQNLNLGEQQISLLQRTNNITQRKFIFDNKSQVNLVVGSNNTNVSVYLSLRPDQYKGNYSLWNATGKTRKTYTMRQTDKNLRIGQYYYLTIVANQDYCNVTMKVDQRKQVALIKENQSILDTMETQEDYIKYFYYIPPSIPNNSTITFAVTPLTPGFMPNIYVQRNDIINQTLNLNSLVYPSINQSTFSQEQVFYQQQQKTYTFSFNVSATNRTLNVSTTVQQNYTVNQTVLVNVTTIVLNKTTNKNQTVVTQQNQTVQVNATRNVTTYQNVNVLNQTYYTLALYWTNFGLSDLPRASYEISYSVTPLTGRITIQQPHEQLSIQQKMEMKINQTKGFLQKKLFYHE